MNVYSIQDGGESFFVEAPSIEAALRAWRDACGHPADVRGDEADPDSITFITDELIRVAESAP